MRITDKYVFFWNGIYSNWYPAKFILDGIQWSNSEQYMMWSKAEMFGDDRIADQILETSDPHIAKTLGKRVKNFDAKKWDEVCKDIVFNGCYAKFSQNIILKDTILRDGRGRNFVEASPYDAIWGIGMSETAEGIDDPSNWKGRNYLGEVLDRVYNSLK